MVSEEKRSILLTIDVEDWFQVENFKGYIQFSTWNSFKLRVEENTHKILDLLDSFVFRPKATFFVLGWIAQKLPHLVREIHDRGHEVASHGVDHHLCQNLNERALATDLVSSKKLLEDMIGTGIYGFRAPSFAINDAVLQSIRSAGYLYDSSYNSFSAHGRYGTIDLSKVNKKGAGYQIDSDFFELPISNLTIQNRVIPLGGGGYFRLFPFVLFKIGMNKVIQKDKAFIFYSHPWEFDPSQPRVEQASFGFKFRHYTNLNRTQKKLRALITCFGHCDFISCKDYLTRSF